MWSNTMLEESAMNKTSELAVRWSMLGFQLCMLQSVITVGIMYPLLGTALKD
jgi:hypothetical protein